MKPHYFLGSNVSFGVRHSGIRRIFLSTYLVIVGGVLSCETHKFFTNIYILKYL